MLNDLKLRCLERGGHYDKLQSAPLCSSYRRRRRGFGSGRVLYAARLSRHAVAMTGTLSEAT